MTLAGVGHWTAEYCHARGGPIAAVRSRRGLSGGETSVRIGGESAAVGDWGGGADAGGSQVVAVRGHDAPLVACPLRTGAGNPPLVPVGPGVVTGAEGVAGTADEGGKYGLPLGNAAVVGVQPAHALGCGANEAAIGVAVGQAVGVVVVTFRHASE